MQIRSASRMLVIMGALGSFVGASCAQTPVGPDANAAATTRGTDAVSGTPTLSQVSPTSGPVGTLVTIAGTGFASKGNTATFGQGYVRDLESADGATLRLTVPEALDLCSPNPTSPCPGAYPAVRPGEYVIAVMLNGKQSNGFTFTVTP